MNKKKSPLHHRAAGGIVFKKNPKNGEIRYFLLQQKKMTHEKIWIFPKGCIDEGEVALDAAIREIREESGLLVEKPLDFLIKTTHTFLIEKEEHKKEVTWYLFQYQGGGVVVPQKSEGMIAYFWASLEEAERMLAYDDLNFILKEAHQKIAF